MGDILSLIDKAEEMFDKRKLLNLKKINSAKFTLDDFLEQFENIRNMGSLDQIMSMIPGVNPNVLKGAQIDDRQMGRIEAIIKSMTKKKEKILILLIQAEKKNSTWKWYKSSRCKQPFKTI